MPSSSGFPSDATVVLLLRPMCGRNLLFRRLLLFCLSGVRVPSLCLSMLAVSLLAPEFSLDTLLMRKKFLIFCPAVLLTLALVFSARPENWRFSVELL